MTVRTDSRADSRPSLAALGAPLRPQVNLLPPEIRSRRALGRTKVHLALALLVVLLLAALGYVYASLLEAQAADDLADVQADVQALVEQQGQYAEVPRIKRQIATAEDARRIGMATEILWTDYLRYIEASTPEAVSITELSTDVPGPMTGPLASISPLDTLGIGSISVMGQASTLPDLSAWMDALDAVPGFSDATYMSAELTDDEGVAYFSITATVRVDETVLASRFAETEEE